MVDTDTVYLTNFFMKYKQQFIMTTKIYYKIIYFQILLIQQN